MKTRDRGVTFVSKRGNYLSVKLLLEKRVRSRVEKKISAFARIILQLFAGLPSSVEMLDERPKPTKRLLLIA